MSRASVTGRTRGARRVVGVILFVLCLPCSGCSLLMDEFTWLDKAAPTPHRAPDAPVGDALERP